MKIFRPDTPTVAARRRPPGAQLRRWIGSSHFSRAHRIIGLAGLALALSIWSAVPAGAASASRSKGRVSFGIEPAGATGADGRPYFSFGATPGATLTDYVSVLNYSSIPLSLQVYATDAVETPSGGFGLLPAGAKPRGVGSWITLPRRDATVLVPPQTPKGPGQFVVPLAVRIPADASPGDHAGGIVASLRTAATNSRGENVILLQRIGTRVFVRVAGALVPKLALTDLHTTYAGTLNPIGKGEVRVSYLVSNTGNVNLALGQSVGVSGLFGSEEKVPLAKVALLLPGASIHENVLVANQWPEFLLHTTVTATPVTPVGGTAAGLSPVSAKTSTWAIPWALLVLIVLVILAVFVAFKVRARRRERRRAAAIEVAIA